MNLGMRWLHRLQNADEAVKRRWLIVFSAAAMCVVIFVWLSYFSALVSSPGATARVVEDQGSQNVGFWDTMKAGAGVLFGALKSAVSHVGEILAAPRSYIIKP